MVVFPPLRNEKDPAFRIPFSRKIYAFGATQVPPLRTADEGMEILTRSLLADPFGFDKKEQVRA